MGTIKTSKLTELLKSKGLSESFIGKFIDAIKQKKKEKEFEKLNNDPRYKELLKKYNIDPVDYNSTKDDPWFK
jgi:hypothetical protein